MAQEDDTDFQNILAELKHAKELEDQANQMQEQIDENTESIELLEEQTDEISEKAGLNEDDKSVIDKNKLPAALTSSEKKRYQNIGKAFIEGAGKEFKNILKASKFKSMMSTVKEKFTAGVQKVKKAIKKAKKAGGFLAKLLVIAGLLGAIFYLFKDKIINAFPNISEYIKGIFEKAKNFIGNLVENGFQFISDGAKSLMNSTIGQIIGYMKEAIGIFFSQTLPDAVFELYVNVLSMFNSDAEDLREEIENSEASASLQSQANTIADEAEKETDEAGGDSQLKAAEEEMAKHANNFENLSKEELTKLQTVSSTAQMSEVAKNKELMEHLNGLVEGNTDIARLVEDGYVDSKKLFEQIRQQSADGQLTREEAFKALQSSIEDETKRGELKFKAVSDKMAAASKSPNVVVEGGQMGESALKSVEAAQAAVEASQTQSFNQLIAAANADKERHDRLTSALEKQQETKSEEVKSQQITANEVGQAQVEATKNITLNATQVITDTLQNAFVELSTAIKNFLDGDKITQNIVHALKGLNENFNKFFSQINNHAKSMLDNLGSVAQSLHTYFNELASQMTADADAIRAQAQAQTEKGEAEKNKRGNVENNFVINVDVTFSQAERGKDEMIKDVVAIDYELNQTLEQTNEILSKIEAKVKNVNLGENVTTNTSTTNIDVNTIHKMVDQHVHNTYINKPETIVNKVTENIVNHDETIENITENVSETIIKDQTILKEMTTNIINDADMIDELAEEIVDDDDAIEQIVNNVSHNNSMITNVANSVVNDQKTLNTIVNNVANNKIVLNAVSNEVVNNETIINELVTNVINNQQIVNRVATKIATNVLNDKKIINNVTNNVEEKVTEEVKNIVVNNINNDNSRIYNNSNNVTNTVNVVQNNMNNTSVVKLVDKQGKENTITLVDKEANDLELNQIRADIRQLAQVANKNRQQIMRNGLQVSKIVKIGNVQTSIPEATPSQSFYALQV